MLNKARKRVLISVLAFAMLLLAACADVEDEAQIYSGAAGDDITWTFDASTGVFTLTGTGEMWGWAWWWYDRERVPWHNQMESITSVVISDGITRIGGAAFRSARNLTSVDIPSSVTYIGRDAFFRATSLTTVYMPGAIYIGAWAFWDAARLTSIDMPSVTYIGDSAFGFASSLTSIDIPASVTYIGRGVFAVATSLASATIRSRDAIFNWYVFDRTHPDFTIHGFAGSTAEEYAIANGHNFVPLDN